MDSCKPSEDGIINQRIFLTQGLRCLPNLSTFNIAKDTLCIDLTLSKMATLERMVLSQWWLLDTCMCDLCLVLAIRVIDIWTGLLDRCPFNWQDGKDIELWFFQHGKICSVLGSFLLGTGTGNVIPGNEWIPASRQKTASATKESSWHKVCGVCQTYQLLTLRRTHCALIWPFARTATLERMFLHVCPFNSTGDGYELDSYTNAASIGTTGKTLS